MLDKFPLKTAVWIYDIENSYIMWANEAALSLWESKSLEELSSRNFAKETSDAVRDSLRKYQQAFYSGESFVEFWHLSPKGIVKKTFCQFSGVLVEKDKMAMMVEAIPSHIYPTIKDEQAIAILATFDMLGNFQSSNPPFKSEFGDNKPHLFNLLSQPTDLADVLSAIENDLKYEEDILLNKLGRQAWFRVSVVVSDGSDNLPIILCHFHNVDERKRREILLSEQAHTDSLTGLLNRRGFSANIHSLLEAKAPLLMCYIDLDGFKMINDYLGHGTGDVVLREVAHRLRQLDVNAPLICRFGGDEFVIAVPCDDSGISSDDIASAIVTSLSAPYKDTQGKLLTISASVGVAQSPENSSSLDDLIRYADAAMYCSKRLGKKRYTTFIPGMEREILRKSIITQHLSVAIENNELSLHYQPIINTTDNSIASFEALLRWHNPSLGEVSPQELIEVAEGVGLIADIENWVISTAIADLTHLRQYTNSQATIAINISSIHIIDPNLPTFLLEQLSRNNLTPADLVVEITESILLDELEKNDNPVEHITDTGVSLSIDDFGTGYSSLAYLYKIKATTVKIDRTFTQALENSEATLASIHALIRSLNMQSLIEGIETEKQAKNAIKAGISLHQGYYYARPQALSYYIKNNSLLPSLLATSNCDKH